jgi:DNA-binding NtrC family response regulator
MDGSTRLLATTAEEFGAAVADDEFHHDLYCKLTVLVLRLEPLRNRRHDLPLLAQHFLERANRREVSPCAGFHSSALDAMQAYDWPGNLAELGRVIDAAHARAAARAAESSGSPIFQIQAEDLPASIRGNLAAAYLPPRPVRTFQPLDELLTEIERKLIESALGKARQNKSRAADLLGISRPRLYRRIKELKLADDSDPEDEAFEADAK